MAQPPVDQGCLLQLAGILGLPAELAAYLTRVAIMQDSVSLFSSTASAVWRRSGKAHDGCRRRDNPARAHLPSSWSERWA